MKLSNDGSSVTGSKIDIACDCLGVAGGWTPAVHLFTQSGGKLTFDETNKVFLPNKYPSEQISVGSCNGDFKIKEIINNLSINLKEFLNIEKTDFDNITVESEDDNSKEIYGYFHQINHWENQTICRLSK